VPDLCNDPVDHAIRLVKRSVVHDDGELVATQAENVVIFADRGT
jgi:hypothetical protein